MMIKKTVPIDQPHQGRGAARGGPDNQSVDHACETMGGFSAPTAATANDTRPQGGDPTYVQEELVDGRSMVPSGPPPMAAESPDAQATLPGATNDATLADVDPATQAYHQAAIKAAPKGL